MNYIKFYFYNGNGDSAIFKIDNINKIKFEKSNNVYTLKVHYQKKETKLYLTFIIDSITFKNDSIYIFYTDQNNVSKIDSNLVSDIDSLIFKENLETESEVAIGNQIWMNKNLEVDKYKNGDSIPEVKDSTEWANLTTGAWCYFDNNLDTGKIYGKLYNWYAVNDSRGLAPEGWHVPIGTELDELLTCLGDPDNAGGTMKESGTVHWNAPNNGATNSSGFTALPGGLRDSISKFDRIHITGFWWTSTFLSDSNAKFFVLNYDESSFYLQETLKNFGFSVRCVRDDIATDSLLIIDKKNDSTKFGINTIKKAIFISIGLPTIKTDSVNNITSISATSFSTITNDGGDPITTRGVCWATSPNPTIAGSKTSDGKGTGSFTSSITGLSACTKYYVRAYATNSVGTAYGNEVFFTTNGALPTLTSIVVDNSISSNSVTSGGNITSDTCTSIIEYGVCWSKTKDPTINNDKSSNCSGTANNYRCNISDLIPCTTYYVKAYATNSDSTVYGKEVSFTTKGALPTLTTIVVDNSISSNSVTSGGNITNDTCTSIIEYGVCWAKTKDPTINNDKTSNCSGTANNYRCIISDLIPCTTYYVKAYATNSDSTVYGKEVFFTTKGALPTLTTIVVDNSITSNSVTSGGNITSDTCTTVIARGVCWSKDSIPTIKNDSTVDGSGIGYFNSNIINLNAGTKYYVRAYATNSAGTAYGNLDSLTTNAISKPTVTTSSISNPTTNSAFCGGNITSDGGSPVTKRGVCWSKVTMPTISNDTTVDGTGTGSFTSSITGLNPNTLYHVRAFAINSVGIAYGDQKSFTTSPAPNKLTVTYPNGGETLNGGETCVIRWTYSGNNSNRFTIELSTNNGESWDDIKVNIPNSSRNYIWQVLNKPSKNCRIKISAFNINGELVSDVCDNVFTITKGKNTEFPDNVTICSDSGTIKKNNIPTKTNKKYMITFSNTFSIWNRSPDNCGNETSFCCGLDAGYLYSIPQNEVKNWPPDLIPPPPIWTGNATEYNNINLRNQTGFRFNGEPVSLGKYQANHCYIINDKYGTGDYLNFQIIDSIKTNGITSPSYIDNCGCIDICIEELPEGEPITKICEQNCKIDTISKLVVIQLKTAILELDTNSTTGYTNKLSSLDKDSLRIVINKKFIGKVDSIRCVVSKVDSNDTPINFGLLVDISQSMNDKTIDDTSKIVAAREALSFFISKGARKVDNFLLMTYAKEGNTILNWTSDTTTIISRIKDLDFTNITNKSYLYKAIDFGIQKLMKKDGNKTLIILSDGDDNSEKGLEDLTEQVNSLSSLRIYIVLIANNQNELKNRRKLDSIAKLTGGRLFIIDSSSKLKELLNKLYYDLINNECCTLFISNISNINEIINIKKNNLNLIYYQNDTATTIRSTSFDCELVKITDIKFPDKENTEVGMSVAPNPFDMSGKILYETNEDGYVEIKIYDLLGKDYYSINKGFQIKGNYSEIIDGSKLKSGSYIGTVNLNGKLVSRKIIVIH
jgi:uncharacterized protein (TIGR02145 family)